MAKKIVHTTAADVARRKAEIEARCITARVTGALPIRDAVDREDRSEGQTVRLDPQTTLLSALVEAGCIELIDEAPGEA